MFFDIIYRNNAPYERIINNRASMMALVDSQLLWGVLGTTTQTYQVHYEGPRAPIMDTLKIPKEAQNGAKIILFALFGMFLTFFIEKTFSKSV